MVQPAVRRRPPSTRTLVALLVTTAVVGLCWAFLVPAWQVADEPQHFSYVETLAENHHLPEAGGGGLYASDLYKGLAATNFNAPIFLTGAVPEWSHEKAARDRRLMQRAASDNGGGATQASNNPPVYYLFDVPPYLAAKGAATTTRLYVLRSWNVLLLLANTAFAWLLVGELVSRRLLPRLAGAATVGLWPMASFLTAAVNPDGMLLAVWTAVFAVGARCAIRGLTLRRGITLGVLVGFACLVKATSFALIPGTLALVAWGLWQRRRELALPRLAVMAAAVLLALVVLPLAWRLYPHPGGGAFGQVSAAASASGLNLNRLASYLWQFYLPPLGFMEPATSLYPIVSTRPVLNTWVAMSIGTFGWANVWFPGWVYWSAASVVAVMAAVAAVGVHRRRRMGRHLVRPRLIALGYIASCTAAIIAGTHWTDYNFFISGAGPFAQGRYILPGVLPVLAITVAAAVASFRQRSGLLAGGWVAGLLVLQMSSIGLLIDRWYVA